MTRRAHHQLAVMAVLILAVAGIAGLLRSGRGEASGEVQATPAATTLPGAEAAAVGGAPSAAGGQAAAGLPVGGDLDGSEFDTMGSCTIPPEPVVDGATGDAVVCVQRALRGLGLLDTEPTGTFDYATHLAVSKLQESRHLFVDGLVGRETALSLGIWTDESLQVIRTPVPAEGEMDSMGYYLSSVASAGKDAPPVPPDSGTGRRLVYQRSGQRVWAIGDDGETIRSWLVSGSKYGNETPGTYRVYSRSAETTAWNGKAVLPKMVRYLQTEVGHIGFHGIPYAVDTGKRYQTEAELGTRLSGGCQRQADYDAAFTWKFAQIDTKVVVI